MLELRLLMGSLMCVAYAVVAQGQVQSTLVYASQAGAALSSDLSNGGGTDDTVALQRILDRAKDGRGLHLVVDGPALIAGLEVYSNTTIECTAGGGFYFKDYTARAIIRNAHRSREAVSDKNIALRGCFINGNRKNQVVVGPVDSPLRLAQEPDGTFRSGLQFFGVHHLAVENVTLLDTYAFSLWVANAKYINVRNVTIRREFTPFPEGGDAARIRAWFLENGEGTDKWGGNDDGMHFNGPIQYLTIDNARLSTWDDGISMTANDYNTNDLTLENPLGPYVGQGSITDVAISNVMFMDAHHGIRIQSGKERVDRILITNVTGAIRERFAVISPGAISTGGNFGAIAFSHINVELSRYPPWAEIFPEYGFKQKIDEFEKTLAAGERPKIVDEGEEADIPLFSLNGRIENLSLHQVSVKVADRGRPLIRVGHTSLIDVMNLWMTVRDSEAQVLPIKLMGRIERLNMSLDWAGKEPIQYRGGSIGSIRRTVQ